MKDSSASFRHESIQDKDTIADLILSLQQGLSKGTLKFDDADGAITLKPAGLLNLVIEASSSSDINVLDVRISWQGSRPDKLKKDISISSE